MSTPMTAAAYEINDRTGFANGEKFASEQEVRDYFTTQAMVEMFGSYDTSDLPDQDALDEMAGAVIKNRWHCEF